MQTCRTFNPESLVKDFNLTDFSGLWHVQYKISESSSLLGTCPTWFFQEIPATKPEKKLSLKNIENFDKYQTFALRERSRAATGNIMRDVMYKGWIEPEGENKMSVFSGIRPSSTPKTS
jgi:hypothetical protein